MQRSHSGRSDAAVKHTHWRAALLTGVLVAAAAIWQAQALASEVYQSEQHAYRVVTVADGLAHPWGMTFLPSGEMLVTERDGHLRVVRDGELLSEPVSGLPQMVVGGQGGLLDVALDPDFADNSLIYLAYAGGESGNAGTEVARGRLDLEAMALRDVETIFRVAPKTPGTAHYGGRLQFHPDGTLYVTLGDRRNYMDEAQELDSHIGTIVRINPDGSVPADNPFADREDAKPEIYTYGNRNVQGIALRPGTETIWAHEHGPRGGDELNILKPGANYGWPEITYGIDYSGATISEKTEAPGMEQPVVYWDPSIAPSGMTFYDGEAFPQWRGDIFLGALAHRHLRRLELDGDEVVAQEELLGELGARIRDVRGGPDGMLYVLTDAADGRILRLEPAGD
ncbi:MAG: PQQ-dependent sugar dehydrogenase [Dichotomicrobium sp.]